MSLINSGSPNTDVYDNIEIDADKFIHGARQVRRTIAHEMGHYVHNVNWDNGVVGGRVSNPRFINLNSQFGGDGIYGYHGAIQNAGRYHVGYSGISNEMFGGHGAPNVSVA